MGFPVGYSELLLPRLVLNAAYRLGFIRSTICCLLRCLGLTDFLEAESSWPNQNEPSDNISSSVCVSAATIRERLPVVAFGVLAKEEDVTCAVCLSELKREEEIRRLSKCMHIFHKDCLDKWLDHGHKTCPLCRSPFLSQGQGKEISEHLMWAIDRCSILNEGVTSIFS